MAKGIVHDNRHDVEKLMLQLRQLGVAIPGGSRELEEGEIVFPAWASCGYGEHDSTSFRQSIVAGPARKRRQGLKWQT